MEGGGGIFAGLRLRLIGFEENIEDKYRIEIEKRGGKIEKGYKWESLRIVVNSQRERFSDSVYDQAREGGAVVLTELWLDDSLESNYLADVKDIVYWPAVSLDGIKGASYIRVAHAGFSFQESRRIERLVDIIGGENVDISNSKYVICNRLQDYEALKSLELLTVNMKWLEECVKQWEELSVDDYIYISWSKSSMTPKHKSRNYRTPHKDPDSAMKSEREACLSSGKKRVLHGEGCRGSPQHSMKRESSSTGKKIKAAISPNGRSSTNRVAVSTCSKKLSPRARQPFASLCRRSLDFNWKKLSEYSASEMWLTVNIPRSKTQQSVGGDKFKGDLLGCYTALSHVHSRGECIKNEITTDSFRISTHSEQVLIDGAQFVEYDEKLARINRKQFVLMVQKLYKVKGCKLTDDISSWLFSIVDKDKVSDRVLKRHVYMVHPVDLYGNFISMYSILLRLRTEDFNKYTSIMKSKRLLKYVHWAIKPFRWSLLNDTVNYIASKQIELNRLKNQVRGTGVTGQGIISLPKKRDNDAFGIMEVLRDCFIHPAMTYQDLLLAVLLADIEPMLLSDVQKALYESGLLENLR